MSDLPSNFGCEYIQNGKSRCKVVRNSILVDTPCTASYTKTGRPSCKLQKTRSKKAPKVPKESGCAYDAIKNRCKTTNKSSAIDAQCTSSVTKSGRKSCKLATRKRVSRKPVVVVEPPVIHREPSIRQSPTVSMPQFHETHVISRESLLPTFVSALTRYYADVIAYPDNKGKIIELPESTVRHLFTRVEPFFEFALSSISDVPTTKDVTRFIKNGLKDPQTLSMISTDDVSAYIRSSILREPTADEIRIFKSLCMFFMADVIAFAHDSASINKRRSIGTADIDKAIAIEPAFRAYSTSLSTF
jgi:hypothetical protein